MPALIKCCQSCLHKISSKTSRVSIMFVLTIVTATFEIIYGIRARSNSLIADGLYSFAEGICLIGVILVLHYSRQVKHHEKKNTFGYERLELLFGLSQEVFLLSISLGVIVDAINHLVNPIHIHDPKLLIYLGAGGIVIGILGVIMFGGYHHDHNIEKEIHDKKKGEFLSMTKKKKDKTPKVSRQNTITESSVMIEQQNDQTNDQLNQTSSTEMKPLNAPQEISILDTFTYENIDLADSRIYATLHALCLHSWENPVTGKEINTWLKYIDPILTLIMVVVIAVHAIPVIFSISTVLIENVPRGINTQDVMKEIVAAVPAIKKNNKFVFNYFRATPKEIYATLHLICDEDVMLSTCTNRYGKEIQNILKSYCVRYFTLQFEYVQPRQSEELVVYNCAYELLRKRRGHTLDDPMTKSAKNAITHI
ncbi:unnamed protein product [Rotaria sordida]|uniref:Cation efflux protein transmembrane domain-containing protein n=1 Tax=Rotaria sordida TaxID=392033 RepID=A0A818Y9F8_9BILA|nr:unnamed protein product [Rotaria sordida]CAF1127257.1 unnamed protein product [Rotaria sordida]CAF3747871.1 unnamed protein product [Rotaria sordida]